MFHQKPCIAKQCNIYQCVLVGKLPLCIKITNDVIKIFFILDWTNMSAELDLLQKNDVRFTTKQNRHLIMKKSFDNTEYAVSTSGKTDKSTKKVCIYILKLFC